MNIKHHIDKNICILYIAGNITLKNALDVIKLKNALDVIKYWGKLLEENEGIKGIVINVGGVAMMDSSGIGTIVSLCTALRKHQTKFGLCSLQPRVEEQFAATGVNKIINIYPTEQEALDSLG